MSPSTREPKYAYGALPIAMPSGWKPSGNWMTAGREPRWAASAGAAPSTTARAAVVTSARVRLDKGDSFQAGACWHPSVPPEWQSRSSCIHSDVNIYWPRPCAATEGGLMGAGHDHGGQALRAGERHRARLWWAAALLAAFMVVEAAAA